MAKNPQYKKEQGNDAPESASKVMGGFLMVPTENQKIDYSEWEDRSLPPVIKPKDFPVGSVLTGTIKSVNKIEIPNAKKLGGIVVIETVAGKCALPLTAVLERALDVKGLGTDTLECPFIDHMIMIKATGQKASAKKAQRDFWTFDVKIKKA